MPGSLTARATRENLIGVRSLLSPRRCWMSPILAASNVAAVLAGSQPAGTDDRNATRLERRGYEERLEAGFRRAIARQNETIRHGSSCLPERNGARDHALLGSCTPSAYQSQSPCDSISSTSSRRASRGAVEDPPATSRRSKAMSCGCGERYRALRKDHLPWLFVSDRSGLDRYLPWWLPNQ